jgi:hypothetical protein
MLHFLHMETQLVVRSDGYLENRQIVNNVTSCLPPSVGQSGTGDLTRPLRNVVSVRVSSSHLPESKFSLSYHLQKTTPAHGRLQKWKRKTWISQYGNFHKVTS